MAQSSRPQRQPPLTRVGSLQRRAGRRDEGTLRFQGRIDAPIDDKVDDWGYTPEQQETRVEEFRRHLAAQNAWNEQDHDFFTLRRFLRARNYDLTAATEMWVNMLNWRKDQGVDRILEEFSFPERERYLICYPQGYHKIDKQGRPVYVQHIGNINLTEIRKVTNEERMLKYNIQEYERLVKHILPICSKVVGHKVEQTFGILDVKGVGLAHMTGEVRRLLGVITKCNQDNYPELLGHMVIINAPYMFKAVYNMVKGMLNPRTQAKIEICSNDYREKLLKWIDADNLPEYLGGRSKGTLLDDIGPWSDPQVLTQFGMGSPSRAQPIPASPFANERRGSKDDEDDGYYSPTELESPSGSAGAAAGPSGAAALVRQGSGQGSGGKQPWAGRGKQPGGADGYAAINLHQNPLAVLPDTEPPGSPASLSTVNPNSARWHQPLVERVSRLEDELPRQLERLKAWMRRTGDATSATSSHRSAPKGTLLWRVETLEESMELLLSAQEQQLCEANALNQLCNPAVPEHRPVRCCGCCGFL